MIQPLMKPFPAMKKCLIFHRENLNYANAIILASGETTTIPAPGFTDGNGDKVDVDGSGFTPDFDASVANPQVLVYSPFAEVVAADDNDLFATICQFEPMQVNEVMNDEM